MSFASRLSIVTGACLVGLLISAPGPAAIAEEPGVAAPTAGDSAVLKRILDNWHARQLRIKTLYFAWQTQWTSKESTVPVIASRTEFWMDEDLRYRTERWWNPKQNATATQAKRSQQLGFQKLSEVAFDGPTSYLLNLFTNPPDGKVQNATGPQPWNQYGRFPFLLAYRPLARGFSHFRVLSQNAIVGKTHCVKLQYRFAGWVENFWVDPAREDLVVAWEDASGRNAATFVTLEYDRNGKYGWVPASWTYGSNPAGGTTSCRVSKFALNERIPQDIFTVKFPPGTRVFDKKLLERYVVAQDGSKSNLLKSDSPATLKIWEALDQTTEFTIDEEPLKDALDFLAQRYQIKLVLDAQAIRQGLIDPTLEVKVSIAGIKMEKTLNLLLQQSKKPLTYEIRQGVLNVIPAKK
jgi:hypothetical protein